MKKIILTLTVISHTLYSAPAYSHLREFQNADGTTFYATPKGNHKFNYIQTQDGSILKYNTTTKNFEFGKIVGKKIVPNGEVYRGVIKNTTQILHQEDLIKLQQKL